MADETTRQLEALARRLREEATQGLLDEVNDGLLAIAPRMIAAARARMLSRLPAAGGLAARAATARMTAERDRHGGMGATVRVTGGAQRIDVRSLDRGRVRHPVFGRPDSWVSQQVEPQTITGAFKEEAERSAPEIEAALRRVAARIDGTRP